MLLLTLLVISLALIVLLIKYQYSYWQRRGFPYDPDYSIPFGALKAVSKHERSMGMAIYDIYLKTKEPYIGIYLLFRPAVLVRDLELVRKVLAQDFASFHDRGVYVDEKNDPLNANLFSMKGKSWRTMRTKLTPSFTSGKLKAMFGSVQDIGNKMVKHLESIVPANGAPIEVDLKEIIKTYAIDVIGSVIFGLEINSFDNPNNTFRSVLTKTRKNTFFKAFFGMCKTLCPPIAKVFVKMGFKNKEAALLRDILRETIEYREKNNIIRKDMLQLLMQLRNTGRINEDDNVWAAQTPASQFKSLSMDEIAAQTLIFYIAGQETTAATAAFTLFELAQQADLLQRVQSEIGETLAKHDGSITYEALQEMKFLELCISETIRKYPGLPMLNRQCTQDYRIPGTDHVIEKGTPIVISLFGIHRDAAYFPNPENYDPERFLESNKNYNPAAYMPFGEGPHHCLAQRMGRINAKLAIVKIMAAFKIPVMEKREIEIDNFAMAIMPKGGVKVFLSRR